MKLYEILPGRLYQRGHIEKRHPLDVAETFRKHHISVVVNLHRRQNRNLPTNVMHIQWPIADNKVPSTLILLELANLLVRFIENGHVVLVHCNAGRNRSSLLSAIIVSMLLGISGKEAIAYMQEKRPNALANLHFVQFLEAMN